MSNKYIIIFFCFLISLLNFALFPIIFWLTGMPTIQGKFTSFFQIMTMNRHNLFSFVNDSLNTIFLLIIGSLLFKIKKIPYYLNFFDYDLNIFRYISNYYFSNGESYRGY